MISLLMAGILKRSFSSLRTWLIVAFGATILSGIGLVFEGANVSHVCLLMTSYSVLSLTVVKFYDSRVTVPQQ